MTQEAITRADLDADQARQETTFTGQVYQLAAGLQTEMHQMQAGLQAEMHQMQADLRAEIHQIQASLQTEMHQIQASLRNEMHQLERRMYFIAALATGLIIGAMQLD